MGEAAGGLWREGLIARLGLLSALFHIHHKSLHIAGFSGQDEGRHSFSFSSCPELYLVALSPSLVLLPDRPHLSELFHPSSFFGHLFKPHFRASSHDFKSVPHDREHGSLLDS